MLVLLSVSPASHGSLLSCPPTAASPSSWPLEVFSQPPPHSRLYTRFCHFAGLGDVCIPVGSKRLPLVDTHDVPPSSAGLEVTAPQVRRLPLPNWKTGSCPL